MAKYRSFLLPDKNTHIYARSNTSKRIPEHSGESEVPPAPQPSRQTALEGWGKCLHVDHIAPSPGQGSTMQRGLPSVSSSSGGKREPGVGGGSTLAFQSTVGHFRGNSALLSHNRTLLWFYHRDHRGIYGAQILWIWLWQRSGEGLATTSTRILSDQVHICSAQVLIANPTGGFAYLQQQAGGGLWPGSLTGCQSADLSPLRRNFLYPRSQLPKLRQGAESYLHLLWRESSDQKGKWQVLEVVCTCGA